MVVWWNFCRFNTQERMVPSNFCQASPTQNNIVILSSSELFFSCFSFILPLLGDVKGVFHVAIGVNVSLLSLQLHPWFLLSLQCLWASLSLFLFLMILLCLPVNLQAWMWRRSRGFQHRGMRMRLTVQVDTEGTEKFSTACSMVNRSSFHRPTGDPSLVLFFYFFNDFSLSSLFLPCWGFLFGWIFFSLRSFYQVYSTPEKIWLFGRK